MTEVFLPDAMMVRAAKRLRAMAGAIENGVHLTDVAAQFRIPVRALRRVAAPRPRRPPKHKRPAITQVALARAAKRIREGSSSYREIAAELSVSASTLIKTLTKRGLTIGRVRKDKMGEAIALYRAGVKISEIREKTGIPTMTLYTHLRQLDSSPARRPRKPTTKRRNDNREPELRKAAELHREGLRLKEITAETGISGAALYTYLQRNGGYTPRRKISSDKTTGM